MKEGICFLSGSCYRWMRLLHRVPMQSKVGEAGSKLGSITSRCSGKWAHTHTPGRRRIKDRTRETVEIEPSLKSLTGASDVYNPLRSPKTSSDFFYKVWFLTRVLNLNLRRVALLITTFSTKYSLNRKIDFLFYSLLFSCTCYAHRVKATLPRLI